VRNAIILIDFIKEKLREGLPLAEAATLAGERRLRPIFLTTMAAAVGVTPMILSGSKMWSPLASVLAVGLIFSMFFTLLVVPVIYVLVFRKRQDKSSAAAAVVTAMALLLIPGRASAQTPGTSHLTLEEAVASALDHSAGIRIARARLQEAEARHRTARADYLPQLAVDATWMKRNDHPLVEIPAGSLGNVPGLGPFPTQDATIGQGKTHFYLQNITLSQPLTQLIKINHGNQVASADEKVAQAELRKMETEIAFKTRQTYEGILIAQAQIEAARAEVAASQSQDQEAGEAVKAGNVLQVIQTGTKARLLQSRHKELSAEAAASDLRSELNDLMGEPLDARFELSPVTPDASPTPAREALLAQIQTNNPELEAAKKTVEKSQSALKAGKAEYIPDISAFVRQTYQDGVPFVEHNTTTCGIALTWTLWDWGKRSGVVGQRAAQASQASENYRRIRNRTEISLDRLLRKVETARLGVDVAEEASAASTEKARLVANQRKAGLVPASKLAEAEAEARASEAGLLAARLGLDLVQAELKQLLGTY
jgi:outer membrane protein TolC